MNTNKKAFDPRFCTPPRYTGVSPVLALQNYCNCFLFAFIRDHSCPFVDNRI
jgi:hypothetical protein